MCTWQWFMREYLNSVCVRSELLLKFNFRFPLAIRIRVLFFSEIHFMIFSFTGSFVKSEWAAVWCECLNNTLILSSSSTPFYTCSIIIRANVLIWLVNQGANSNNISEVLETFANQHWNERHAMDIYRKSEREIEWRRFVKHKYISNSVV